MKVEPTTAAWLKSANRSVTTLSENLEAIWGDLAISSEGQSPFAERVTAENRAGRQLSFLGHPIAVERCVVDGYRSDLLGRLLDLTADRGILNNVRCLVIGVDEQQDADATILTVLRRLD